MPSLTIIAIVDDDSLYRMIAQKLLTSTDLVQTVLSFENGVTALDYLQDSHNFPSLPDIILLDINMPQMNGFEFLAAYEKIVTTLPKTASIYIVSSSMSSEDKTKAQSYTVVDGYIVKPLRKEDVLQILTSK